MLIPQRGGLPHSDTSGSKPARGSPKIFAACHVLHRLLAPRHPPDALLLLNLTGPRGPENLAQDPSNRRQNLSNKILTNSHTHTFTPPKNLAAWPGITWTTHRPPPTPATDLAITTSTRVAPHAPEDATEPDSQSPKNTSAATDQRPVTTNHRLSTKVRPRTCETRPYPRLLYA